MAAGIWYKTEHFSELTRDNFGKLKNITNCQGRDVII